MKRLKVLVLSSIFAIILVSCQKDKAILSEGKYSMEEYSILSDHLNLPQETYSFAIGNLQDSDKIDHIGTLGRVLFYDKNLSGDASVSCASCHQQSLAFADNKALSEGAGGKLTDRNSIALGSFRSFGGHYSQNVTGEAPGLFWDERADSVKDQLKQSIENPKEMNMDLAAVVNLVQAQEYYQILHQKAFDTEEILEDQLLTALEAFINSIGSVNPKFESELLENLNFITGDQVTGVSENQMGIELFINNCNGCHQVHSNLLEDLIAGVDITAANNGLTLANGDLGIYEHSLRSEDKGKFKIPKLRNVELSAPYMHDGRFETLEEVVEFYNSDIEMNENLHPSLRVGDEAKRLNLTAEEKAALVGFLKLLTDEEITSNPKWSDPFIG